MATTTAVELPQNNSTNVRFETLVHGLLRAGMGVLGRVAPATTTRAAEKLFFTPRRHTPPARELGWLESAIQSEITVDDQQVAVYSWGSGRPVVLVHGWEGRASQMGGLATAIAAAGYRAVAFDAPGHGHSDGHTSRLPDFVDTLQAIAAREGPLAAVIGHSMGAGACAVALAEGLDAERAVLISSWTHLDNVVDNFANIVGLTPAVEQRFRQRMEDRFGAGAWQYFSPLERAPEIGVPALVVHDLVDSEIPVAEAFDLQSVWPDASLMTTRGLGHRRILRDPEVAVAIVAFLARQPEADKEKNHA